MKKLILATALCFSASFLNAAEQTCYVDTLGSENTIFAPAANTNGNWSVEYTLTNISSKPVNVKLEFTNINGQNHSPSGVSYFGNFDSTNDPSNLATGAVLQPGELGRLILNDDTVTMIGPTKISWSADTCLQEALVASFNNQFSTTSRLDRGLVFLNNGKAF